MRGLSRQHSGDPATVDISRVLRLPGLYNKKYDATFQITAGKLTSAIYSPHDFPACNLPPTPLARARSLSKLTNTPSHRDWAYVCRALWGARDPNAVKATLIDKLARRAQARNKPKPRLCRVGGYAEGESADEQNKAFVEPCSCDGVFSARHNA